MKNTPPRGLKKKMKKQLYSMTAITTNMKKHLDSLTAITTNLAK